mmetsp:Transcript_4098/g.11664  ORF Transcript_4098/g.11664 Transcript_4098/m.11664 type:complete len:216 (-) Transcript_4098:1443-2090(-)
MRTRIFGVLVIDGRTAASLPMRSLFDCDAAVFDERRCLDCSCSDGSVSRSSRRRLILDERESSSLSDSNVVSMLGVLHDDVLFLTTQYVCNEPLPLAMILSSRSSIQRDLPASIRSSAVSCETWMRFGMLVCSMRAAVLTVSPKSWNLDLSPRKTPAVTGPLCRPNRIFSSRVSGPRVTANSRTMTSILATQCIANRVITTAWLGMGSGRPVTAT